MVHSGNCMFAMCVVSSILFINVLVLTVVLFHIYVYSGIFQTLVLFCDFNHVIEPVREKTNNLGSDQVRHKSGCTLTEEG